MSNDSTIGESAPYVQLFQKAHQKIVMLERLDEQVQQILAKRQELHDELRDIQSQLNEEFDTRLKSVAEAAARPVLTINPEAKRGGARFAAQAIDAAG